MRDDPEVDALQRALLTALTSDAEVREHTRHLAPAWTDQMTDDAIDTARKLAKRWCRTDGGDQR